MEAKTLKKIFGSKDVERPELTNIDTFIGPDVVFEGTLRSNSNVCICIDGLLKGNVETKGGVIVTKSGRLEADIAAEFIVVNGSITGNVIARQQLDIGDTGRITGNVEAGSVAIAIGGVLDGFCKMFDRRAASSSQSDKSVAPQKDKAAVG